MALHRNLLAVAPLTEEIIMSVTPEKIVETGKAKLETNLKTIGTAGSSVFAAAEKLVALNVAATRATIDDSAELIRKLLAAKDPKALAAVQLGAIAPALEKAVTYFGSVAGITAQTQSDLVKLAEAEALVLVHNANATLEGVLKSAPIGADAAVKSLKSAVASVTSVYQTATEVAKQVTESTQAGVKSATDVAVETVSKNTQAAVSALKVAA